MNRWTPDFDHYASTLDGAPLVVFVDLGARAAAPIADWAVRVRVAVWMRRPGPDGLRSPDEEPELADLEDDLVEALAGDGSGAYLGRVTHRGRVEHVFYRATGPAGRIPTDGWKGSTEVADDPPWALYRDVLLPDVRRAQHIANRRRLVLLHGRGDAVERARDVVHELVVPDRDRVAEALHGLGFEVETDGTRLLATRADAPSAMDGVTDTILAVVQRGSYEGWTAPLVR